MRRRENAWKTLPLKVSNSDAFNIMWKIIPDSSILWQRLMRVLNITKILHLPNLHPLLGFLTFSIVQWKLFWRQQWNGWWWVHSNLTSGFFSSEICTLCKGISWQVNLSRLDFPWILRWCYFRSLSAAFWIFFFVSLLFALSSRLQCQIRLVIAKL